MTYSKSWIRAEIKRIAMVGSPKPSIHSLSREERILALVIQIILSSKNSKSRKKIITALKK